MPWEWGEKGRVRDRENCRDRIRGKDVGVALDLDKDKGEGIRDKRENTTSVFVFRITIVQNLRETRKVSGDRNYRIPRAKFARRAKARSPKP